MLSTQQLGDLIEKIVAAPTLESLHNLLQEACTALGHEKFSYSVLFPPGSLPGLSANQLSCREVRHGKILREEELPYLFLSNWPDELYQFYLDHHYLRRDPGLKHGWSTPVPLLYDEPWFVQQMDCPPGERAIKCGLFLTWLEFDFISGLSVGIQGPRGEAATLTFSTSRWRDITPPIARLCAALAQGLLPYLHHRAMELAQWRDFLQENRHLTPRELECLRWASEGKTAWEIGSILHITERTVVAHLNNASNKLGANNRIQAVARAVAYKLI
ncbi:MAG: autoinducer binding domain-containing protein [Magnetococcales bacterium]|nr:autoinducer binding domain-containing protein [Magnetococcales bacterium]